jgi:hypothetical protein
MHTVAQGAGLGQTVAGVITNFTIIPRDEQGHPVLTSSLNLLLRHNMSERHSKFLTDCQDMHCTVYFVCIEAGPYFVSLRLNGIHIQGSPFIIRIIAGESLTVVRE